MIESPQARVCDVDEPLQVPEEPAAAVEREGSPDPAPAAAAKFGLVAEQLRANGYALEHGSIPLALLSERTAAVSGLALLILAPIADQTLNARRRAIFEKSGLLAGPVRVGCDRAETYPLRMTTARFYTTHEILKVGVCLRQGLTLTLDGVWPDGTLLDVRLAELPGIGADEALEYFERLSSLPYKLADERRPRPKPSRKGWIGR